MLAHLLTQPILAERSSEQPRRAAIVLPFGRLKTATSAQIDSLAKYPCTRMHGAAFEAEFYPAADDSY